MANPISWLNGEKQPGGNNKLALELRKKFSRERIVAKCFFVKSSKAPTVNIEQLVAMFSPLNLL